MKEPHGPNNIYEVELINNFSLYKLLRGLNRIHFSPTRVKNFYEVLHVIKVFVISAPCRKINVHYDIQIISNTNEH